MAEQRGEFALLIEKARAGCPEAAQELYDRYSDHVRRVVRHKMNFQLRVHFDSTDFLQSVWGSFFRGMPDFRGFDGPQSLLRFLCDVAHNKITDAFRKRTFSGKSKSGLRETPIEDMGPQDREFAAADATPSQEAIAEETWRLLLRGKTALSQRILELLREGHSHGEIAAKLRCSPKAVQRLVQKLNGELS